VFGKISLKELVNLIQILRYKKDLPVD